MKIKKIFFSPVTMGVLFILLALSMAVATFVEKNNGTAVALEMVYEARWFELLILLLAVNLSGRIISEKLYRREKFTIFLFHAAFLVMIAGAFITRYFGDEGVMHIRETESSDEMISSRSGVVTLAFSIKLVDFIIDRYPGSDSPSGYRSEIVLTDEKNGVEKPFSIYMNNILKYRGYRFYQSSYDSDESGTILSVNYDSAGILVTYTGYALLFLFIILSLINKKSLFHTVNARHWKSTLRKPTTLVIILFALQSSGVIAAQKSDAVIVSADELGRILIQDQKGRTKPLYSFSSDIVRKVTGKNKFEEYSPVEVVLGFYLDFDNWKDKKIIKTANRDIRNRLGVDSDMASFSDLVDLTGSGGYKLAPFVEAAYSKAPSERSKFDKEVIKTDERLNICFMINQGEMMRIFPLKDGSGAWGTPQQALEYAVVKEDSLYLSNILQMYIGAVAENDIVSVNEIVNSVILYQQRFSEYTLPSTIKISTEIIYNKVNLFEKLFPFYATLGLILVIVLVSVEIGRWRGNQIFIKTLTGLLLAGAIAHTIALALRWYIAGHSPMTNGYESMIFISWVTILAGFIFRKRSPFALAATAILSSLTLLVAHMSFMDPEITNLVPVLKSYWLTLHVSVITGSYAFLGLGALLGLINIILISVSTSENRERISATTDELTVLNYKTLTLGLYFLTIGTFLGAVWANESWGRYWGWDPKETWSLITIIVYSFVVHSKAIPGLKDIFIFNTLSLFSVSSVLMTYFGVNYYLSGLHSYANGEFQGIPLIVYAVTVSLVAVAVAGYMGYRRGAEEIRDSKFEDSRNRKA